MLEGGGAGLGLEGFDCNVDDNDCFGFPSLLQVLVLQVLEDSFGVFRLLCRIHLTVMLHQLPCLEYPRIAVFFY